MGRATPERLRAAYERSAHPSPLREEIMSDAAFWTFWSEWDAACRGGLAEVRGALLRYAPDIERYSRYIEVVKVAVRNALAE